MRMNSAERTDGVFDLVKFFGKAIAAAGRELDPARYGPAEGGLLRFVRIGDEVCQERDVADSVFVAGINAALSIRPFKPSIDHRRIELEAHAIIEVVANEYLG